MAKKVIKKDFLDIHKRFSVHVSFSKRAIRLLLLSERGVIAWKTSRSENFFRKARVTRITASHIGMLMGTHMKSLGIKSCEVVLTGAGRKSFCRALLFSLVEAGSISVTAVELKQSIRFGGTKPSKRARK